MQGSSEPRCPTTAIPGILLILFFAFQSSSPVFSICFFASRKLYSHCLISNHNVLQAEQILQVMLINWPDNEKETKDIVYLPSTLYRVSGKVSFPPCYFSFILNGKWKQDQVEIISNSTKYLTH